MDAIIVFSHAGCNDYLDQGHAGFLLQRAVNTCLESRCFNAVRVFSDLPDACPRATERVSVTHLHAAASGACLANDAATLMGQPSAWGAIINQGVEDVLFCNPLAPFLGVETLRAAVQTFFEQAQTPLASVTHPKDHPCQLFAFYHIDGLGFVPLLENAPAPGDEETQSLRSQVFSCNWSQRQFAPCQTELAPGMLFFECPTPGGVVWNVATLDTSPWPAPYLWEYVDERSARIQYDPSLLASLAAHSAAEERLAGWGHDAEKPFGDIIVFRTPTGGLRLLSSQCVRYPAGGRITLQPLPLAGHTEADVFTAYVPVNGVCEALVEHPGECATLNYTLMKNVEQEGWGMQTPLFPDTQLWRHDDNGVSHNRLTGNPIHGRQEFPEVLEALPCFLACRVVDMQAVAFHGVGGGFAYAIVPESESLLVRSRKDMLAALMREEQN